MLPTFPLTPVSPNWRDDRLPTEKVRDEQAFYDRFAGDKSGFDWMTRIGAGIIAFEFVLAIGGMILGRR